MLMQGRDVELISLWLSVEEWGKGVWQAPQAALHLWVAVDEEHVDGAHGVLLLQVVRQQVQG